MFRFSTTKCSSFLVRYYRRGAINIFANEGLKVEHFKRSRHTGANTLPTSLYSTSSDPHESLASHSALNSETIAAVVTGGHSGAVAIIRISGPDAVSTAAQIFKPGPVQARDSGITAQESKSSFSPISHRIYYGHIVDGASIIDEALMLPMLEPRSYTKEDVVELQCHGGGVCAERVLQACLKQGCRLARPGEFTLRAFLNGRIELSQAESIAQLVTARTVSAADSAIAGLKGGIGIEIRALRTRLVELIAEIEARIDFDDDVPDVDMGKLKSAVGDVQQAVDAALGTAKRGQALRNGVQVAIVGRPNVGKSSLLNVLCGSEKAIVTNVPGTTRDIVDAQVDIKGIPVTFLDTAGIRSTDDAVEAIGVERSQKAAIDADILVFVYDAQDGWTAADRELFQVISEGMGGHSQKPPFILVANKEDCLTGEVDLQSLPDYCHKNFKSKIAVSAATRSNITLLEDAVETAALTGGGINNAGKGRAWAVNERQAAALLGAKQSLQRLNDSIESQLPLDFWTIDLRDTVDHLGEVTGDIVTEEVLDSVFSKFCIGK